MTRDDQGRPPDGPEWLTLTDAAARSGYSRDALRQRIRRGTLPHTKDNVGQLRVRARDLADLPPPDTSPDDPERSGGTATDIPGRTRDVAGSVALDVLRSAMDDLRDDLERT